jgi:hypothetical protein
VHALVHQSNLEMTVFKKLIPVIGLLAFVAGPVFAADAPPASSSAASSAKSTHHHKMATHKHSHHHKKASSSKQPS